MDRLIVGLGNPGIKYHNTRHNIGFDVLEGLSFYQNLNWISKFKGEYSLYNSSNGDKVYFLRPQTFMNLSGESVLPLVNFFKIKIENILVLHDELDLPFGTIAIKNGGGLAGHNGLRSINACLGGPDFKRMKIGIGRPNHGDISNWVLSTYSGEDKDFFPSMVKNTAQVIEEYIEKDFEIISKKYIKKKLI